MDIARIKQSMLKQAAVDHTRVYTDEKQLPREAIEVVNPTVGSTFSKFYDRMEKGYEAHRDDPWYTGNNNYDVNYSTSGGRPSVKFRFPIHGTGNFPGLTGYSREGGFDNDDVYSINIDPTRLPSFKAGMRLLAPSYRNVRWPSRSMEEMARSANRDRVPFTVQPFNMEQLNEIETGDPAYLGKRLAHYRGVPEQYWEKANLRLNSPEEIEAWKKYIPELKFDGVGPAYTAKGHIDFSPYWTNYSYDDVWGRNADNGWKRRWDRASNGGQLYESASWPGYVAEAFLHELRHQNTIGRVQRDPQSTKRLVPKYNNIYYDPSKPVSKENMPTLMRPRDRRSYTLTNKQFNWAGDHAIESYAVSEDEINQALLAMNAGRYALKRDMENDPDNPNYAQIKPEVLKRFKALPDFIAPGEEGKKQLDEMMQLFAENPELRVLMPGDFRAVGYYQNLKAAVDNAKTDEEREYFQNLMDHFIYSKAFLANNQKRTVPSYTDVQRMRA